MMRNLLVAALAVAILPLIAGCGGGGGGPEPEPGTFVLSGTVKAVPSSSSLSGSEPVQGARVTVAGRTATTNSEGQWSLSFSERPMVETFSVNATAATNANPACYSTWASFDGNTYGNTTQLSMPLAPASGMDVGTIYLLLEDNGPPPPPY